MQAGRFIPRQRHGSDDQGVNSLVDQREKESVVLKNTQTALKRETGYEMSDVQGGAKWEAMMSSQQELSMG